MASRRSQRKRNEPARSGGTLENVESFDLAQWARRLIGELPDDTPAEELALLNSQVSALSAQTPAAALMPVDPTAPQVVRDLRNRP